ncbi:hypothetical protein GGI02_003817, partial [Coemansia sp. RSA 2322]
MPLEFTKEYRQNVAPLMQQLANLDVVRDMVDGAECVRKEYYWPAGLSRMIQAPETLIYGALATRDNLPIVPLVFKWQCGCTPKHLNAKAYSSSFKERLQAGTSTDLRVPGLSMVQFLGSGLKFESTLGVDSSSTSLGDSGPAAVHPGVSAALLDDITARLTFSNAPNKTTFTANFQLDYLAPVPIDSFVVMDAWITAREGRKTFVYSHLAHALSGQML